MDISKRINLNFLSQLGGKAFCLFFALLTTFILRRFLGKQNFGDYIFALSFITVFVTLSDFGSHLVSVKEASQRKDKAEVMGNILFLRAFFSLLALAASFLIVCFFLKKSSFLFFALPLIFVLSFKNSLMVIFHTRLKLYFASLQEVLFSLISLLSAFFIVVFQKKLEEYFLSFFILAVFILIVFSFLVWRQFKPRFCLDYSFLKKFLNQSWPLGGILLLFTLYSRLDTFLLKFLWGAEVLGAYGLAYKIYENLVLPAAFFMNAVLPLVAQAVIKNRRKLIYLLKISADLLLFASGVFVILVLISAPLIMKVLTGCFSLEETLALRILVLGLPFAFLNHLTGYVIITIKKQKQSLIISFFALLFNLIANLFLIPRFSFRAAAVNTVLTQALVFIFSARILKKEIGFSPYLLSWPKTIKSFILKRGGIFDESC